MIRIFIAVILLCLTSSAASAAEVEAPAGTVHKLSAEDIAAIQNAKVATAEKAAVYPAGADEVAELDTRTKRKIHGQIGFGVGTGGYTEMFGTVVAPLGEDGTLAVSIARQSGGRYYRDYRRRR